MNKLPDYIYIQHLIQGTHINHIEHIKTDYTKGTCLYNVWFGNGLEGQSNLYSPFTYNYLDIVFKRKN